MDPSFALPVAKWEVEVELRRGESVRHVWLVEDDRITEGDALRLDDDGADGDWWTVARTFGRRLVHPVEGVSAPSPLRTEESS